MFYKGQKRSTHWRQWMPNLSVRLLGLIHLIVAYSSLNQYPGLIGSHGIRPWVGQANYILQKSGGIIPWEKMPTLLWWTDHSNQALQSLHYVWIGAALCLCLGILTPIILVICYAVSLSFSQVQAPFLPFQWDLLLHECSLLAVLYVPWTWRIPIRAGLIIAYDWGWNHAYRIGRWGLRLLLFKLMFDSGMAKLMSVDPQWENLHALHFHFWTQPLPHIGGVWAQSLPHHVKQLGVIATWVIELWIPFLLLFRVRHILPLILVMIASLWWTEGVPSLLSTLLIIITMISLDEKLIPFYKKIGQRFSLPSMVPLLQFLSKWQCSSDLFALIPIALLMLMISATGSYGFFQLLVLFLILTQFNSQSEIVSKPLADDSSIQSTQSTYLSSLTKTIVSKTIVSSLLITWVCYSLIQHVPWIPKDTLRQAVSAEKKNVDTGGIIYDTYWAYQQSRRWGSPWQAVARYGLFARMTTERVELVIEASQDGQDWHTYPFKHKTNHVSNIPAWTGVEMPRLDWQMWFEAMRPQCVENWFIDFLQALLEHKEAVFDLLDRTAFNEVLLKPRLVRVRKLRFEQSSIQFWRSKNFGIFCPVMTLKELKRGRRRVRE
jgi:hypothetical protein